MKKATFLVLLIMGLAFIVVPSSEAADGEFSVVQVGVQWVDPVAFGPSGIWELSSAPIQFQAVLGLNNFPSPVVRGKYMFGLRDYLDGYAYGAIGAYEVKDDDGDKGLQLYGGVGGGVEWDWQELDADLPPFSYSLEIGYNHTHLSMGFGIHFRL